MSTKWNLVDNLSKPGECRVFSMPLASVPQELQTNNTINWADMNALVSKDQYTPEDPLLLLDPSVEDDGQATLSLSLINPVLKIRIAPPVDPGTFVDDSTFPNVTLPHPSIRLHAICQGTLTFKPAEGVMKDRLILATTYIFLLPWMIEEKVKWWARWTKVGCVPQYVIYENVDKEHLKNVLEYIAIPQNDASENNVEPTHGLSFPNEVTSDNDNKEEFINQFLLGTENYYLAAKSGAYIGRAATESGVQSDSEPRILNLYVQYQGHTSTTPHLMNPRELFHLLFGDDSEEKNEHPLLKKIDEVAGTQTLQPETKRMYLRPPLRTHARVMWEAQKEIDLHSANWEYSGSLGPDRLYNHAKYFLDDTYEDIYKCNVFISDISLRAGFRVPLFLFLHTGDYHYHTVKQYRLALYGKLGSTTDPESISNRYGHIWARRWDTKWASISPASDIAKEVNRMMEEEGRCMVLLHAPHIMLVKEVDTSKTIKWKSGLEFIKKIKADVREAHWTDGAQERTANYNNSELILFELHPGKDPDTKMGIADLNVIDEKRTE